MRYRLVDHVGDDAALGLPESGESFVGVDGDEDPGVARAVSDVGVYGGDFHGVVTLNRFFWVCGCLVS